LIPALFYLRITTAILALAVLALSGCTTTGLFEPPAEKDFFPADNPDICYMGRVDFSKPGEASFDWPGVSISFEFEGNYCGIVLKDGGNDYNYFIDNKFQGVIITTKEVELYENVVGLPDTKHSLLITKRTEGSFGIGTFKGIFLEKGKKLFPVPSSFGLKIEFIGDSITCGYGDESIALLCGTHRNFENNYLAYCSLAARKLNAEYNIVAASGKGIIHNYGDSKKISDDPMPLYYERILFNDAASKWNFKAWIPQVVVINLGTNDYLTEPKPDDEVFIDRYIELISRVRMNYPTAEIFCLCGTMAVWPQCDNIQEVVKRSVDSGDARIHYVATPSIAFTECGCDLHPNLVAHITIADGLVKEISKYIN